MSLNRVIIFLLFAYFGTVGDLQAFSPQCISVGANGSVSVTWDQSGTSGANFRSWHIYYSATAGGPFSVLDSNLIYTDTTEIHATANAVNSNAYYYIVFTSNNGTPDIISDTIHAINLNINNSGGYANLSWNPTYIPLNPNDNPYYLIYREYPTGVFTLIDSVDARLSASTMGFQDLITICDDTIKYRIEVHNSFGCTSVSALKGDRFQDTQVPIVPVLDSVSVDASGNAVIGWQPSLSSDTKKYIVFLQGSGVVTSVDTVIGINSTFLQTTISAAGSSQTFFILALDSCNNISGPTQTHSSIFATSSFDRCTRSSRLSWSGYNFWGTPPLYEILVSLNGGPETLVDTTSSTTYSDTNLTSGALMCYRIRAVDVATGITTTSNRTCITPSFPPPPAYCYIRKATVISDDLISVVVHVDPFASVNGYTLYRSNTQAGPYSVAGTINTNGVGSVTFYDNVAADQGPYFYYVSILDSCGTRVFNSQIVQTIVLSAEANDDYINTVYWNGYEGWPTGVRLYNLLVTVNGVTTTIQLANPMLPPYSYLDSVFDNFDSDGSFCYTIEAIERQGNPYSFQDTSRSNVVCVEQKPLIYIPNAFNPGGDFNTVFYPYNSFVSPEGYSLDIYNRWGELIFHSGNPLEGWPGTSNGVFSPEGVYVYRLVASDGRDGKIERVGAVTLIR